MIHMLGRTGWLTAVLPPFVAHTSPALVRISTRRARVRLCASGALRPIFFLKKDRVHDRLVHRGGGHGRRRVHLQQGAAFKFFFRVLGSHGARHLQRGTGMSVHMSASYLAASSHACTPVRMHTRTQTTGVVWPSICAAASVMACIVMAYKGMAYVVMAYIVMACIVMAYKGMAYVVMVYIVMAQGASSRRGQKENWHIDCSD